MISRSENILAEAMAEILVSVQSDNYPSKKLDRITKVVYGASEEILSLPPCDDNKWECIEKALRLISCTKVSGKPSYQTLREAKELLEKALQ